MYILRQYGSHKSSAFECADAKYIWGVTGCPLCIVCHGKFDEISSQICGFHNKARPMIDVRTVVVIQVIQNTSNLAYFEHKFPSDRRIVIRKVLYWISTYCFLQRANDDQRNVAALLSRVASEAFNAGQG